MYRSPVTMMALVVILAVCAVSGFEPMARADSHSAHGGQDASGNGHGNGNAHGHGNSKGAAKGMPRSERPADARLYFITPAADQVVTSPVTVRFGLEGMGVAPAGVDRPGTGHHHLVIDAELPPANLPVPKNEHYRHFGKGQTQVSLELPPGKHTLQLILADHFHIPHDPPIVSEKITITVKASK